MKSIVKEKLVSFKLEQKVFKYVCELGCVKSHGSEIVPEVYEAHQMLSVSEYPEHAGNYKNMQALTRHNGEHLRAHKGNYQNGTCWYYDYESGNYYKIGG